MFSGCCCFFAVAAGRAFFAVAAGCVFFVFFVLVHREKLLTCTNKKLHEVLSQQHHKNIDTWTLITAILEAGQ